MSRYLRTHSIPFFSHLITSRSPRKAAGLLALGVAAVILPASANAEVSLGMVPSIPTLIQRHHDDTGPDFSTLARQKLPWFVSLGVYFPTFTGDGTSNSVGSEVAVGYRYAIDNADFRISARGQMFNITDGFGNQSNINVSEVAIDALYRVDALYFGPGIAFGSVTGTTDGFTVSGTDETVFTATLGYDFTTRLFVEARYQYASVDAYKGYSINLGLRF